MSRLDDAISDVAYVLDCLMALRNIYQTGHHCNDCGNRECGYAPAPGQQIRYNCPLWSAENEQRRAWISKDKTFCYYSKCSNTRCERHASHIKQHDIPHSFGFFKECKWWNLPEV